MHKIDKVPLFLGWRCLVSDWLAVGTFNVGQANLIVLL